MAIETLEFEEPIARLLKEIDTLGLQPRTDARDREIESLRRRIETVRGDLYRSLTPWQRVLVARHPNRPGLEYFIEHVFTDFIEIHGDRRFADDHAIMTGFADYKDHPVLLVGHVKGTDTKEKIFRNFGMPKPEGYRKALRLMRLAEKFGVPVFTFIDTPGAYPGVGAEERSQSEAIGRNLYVMAELKVPIICTVIGEGGSGGALAIAVGDTILMLQYSTYSVISPEGCASILWKSADYAAEAAETLGITSTRLKALGLIDRIVAEPLGGAHRDYDTMMQNLKKALQESWRQLKETPLDGLLEARFEKLIGYGKFKEVEQK